MSAYALYDLLTEEITTGTIIYPESGVNMDNKTYFLAHCLEEYKRAKQINGKQVINIFNQYGVLDYIVDCYDALHTTGPTYIVEDIDLFIAARK